MSPLIREPLKVFYSWQADQDPALCRTFIEACLEKALKKVIAGIVEPAQRPGMTIDKDTKGVPGSPPIADTIFAKIDEAYAFVGDFTFVGKRVDGRPTPNPNVLIEYGWALNSLTHSKIIGVMNTFYGMPDEKSLPFNMRHRTWPIRYCLKEGANEDERREARDDLVRQLTNAIKDIVANTLQTIEGPSEPAFVGQQPKDGNARFRARGEPLGTIDATFGRSGADITLKDGPAVWLRVMPHYAQPKLTRNVDLLSIVHTQGKQLNPMGYWTGGAFVRGPDGIGMVTDVGRGDTQTSSTAYLFQSGEIWIVNAELLADDYLPNLEKTFVTAFKQSVLHLEHDRGIAGPYRWVAGIENTQNRLFTYVQPSSGPFLHIFPTRCTKSELIGEGVHQASDPVHLALVPFFEEIYDSCGLRRPAALNEALV